MDSGQWALIGVAFLGLVGTIYTVKNTRKNTAEQTDVAADTNDISEFEANIRAFNLRATNAEARAEKADKKYDDIAERVEKLEEKDRARERQLNRIRVVVQKWFAELSAAWPDEHPMPTISDEDQELLGITISKHRGK
jgi:hypothetical protein